MVLQPVEKIEVPATGTRLFDCVAQMGSSAHSYHGSAALLSDAGSTRNLADMVHFLCAIHGRYPGVIDHALTRVTDPIARGWLTSVFEAFSDERAFLARLAIEVGPIPSTAGAASAEAMLLSQRHTIDMLARSERNGCAVGAAMSLILDWVHIRKLLNIAGNRFGIEPPPCRLADTSLIKSLADSFGSDPAVERALLFGAEQLMLQHYGLWDLLEARQMARAGG